VFLSVSTTVQRTDVVLWFSDDHMMQQSWSGNILEYLLYSVLLSYCVI